MYAIAAKTGGGKTAFCLTTALYNARQGLPVFYASLEMSAKMLALRSLSAMTGLPSMSIEKGQLLDESLQRVRAAAEEFRGLPIYFYDKNMDTGTLKLALQRMEAENGLEMAVIDYIALLKDEGSSGYERLTKIADDVRGFATDFDIPMLVVSQLNRASLNREGGRPQVQDFKETGQIENNSGGAVFPYLLPMDEHDQNTGVRQAELIVAKNRHGPNDVKIPVEFLPQQMIWRERGEAIVDPPQNRR